MGFRIDVELIDWGESRGWPESVLTVCMLAVLIGCRDGSVDGAGAGIESYREVHRIGSLEGGVPEAFGSIEALQVDRTGRIYVLDGQAKEVRVFDSAGAFIRTIGSPGRGPGELHTPVGLAWDLEANLWVVDPGNARYSVFDTTGRHVAHHRRKLASYVMPWTGGFTDDGRLWESFNLYVPGRPEIVGLVGLNQALEPVDTVLIGAVEEHFYESRPGVRAHVPFTPYLAVAFDPAGTYWVGDAEEYRISRVSLAGDTLGAVEVDYEPVRVTKAERDSAWTELEWYREMGGTVDRAAFPDRKPAFDALHVDRSGRLWVHLRTQGDALGTQAQSVFEIVSQDGLVLGRIRTEPRLEMFRPRPLLGDRIVAVTRDALDVPYVVVLQPER